MPPGQAAQRYVREHGGNGAITVVASALTAAPIDAALANCVMAHADETDDSHNESRSHPGCSVVPAALAAGEEFGIKRLQIELQRSAREPLETIYRTLRSSVAHYGGQFDDQSILLIRKL